MKIVSIFGIFTLVLFFSGCSFSQNPKVNTVNISNQTRNYSIKKSSKGKTPSYDYKKPYTYSGSIKGIITVLSYNKKNRQWLYEITGKDTSNKKLPYAKFYHYKKLANIGDFVYVILKNSTLVDFYFIKKANRKISKKVKHKIKRKKTKKIIKGGKILKILPPVEENIVF